MISNYFFDLKGTIENSIFGKEKSHTYWLAYSED